MRSFLVVILFVVSGLRVFADRDTTVFIDLEKAQNAEFAAFGRTRVGITDSLELSSYLIGNFILPNTKISYLTPNTKHPIVVSLELTRPTSFLNRFAREGNGGLIDPNVKVPSMFGINGRVDLYHNKKYHSRQIGGYYTLGVNSVFSSGENTFTSIDFPLIYQRTSVYNKGYLFQLAYTTLIRLGECSFINVKAAALTNPTMSIYAFEQRTFVSFWERHRLQVGYKLSIGNYPYGAELRMFPFLDIKF